MVVSNGGQEGAECYIKRDYGGGKGATLEIYKVWRERNREGISEVGF